MAWNDDEKERKCRFFLSCIYLAERVTSNPGRKVLDFIIMQEKAVE